MSLMIGIVIFTRVDDGYIGRVRELKGLELELEGHHLNLRKMEEEKLAVTRG